jgi:hypothetical protein
MHAIRYFCDYYNHYCAHFRKAGQVGYISCNMRSSAHALIGDTYYLKDVPVEPFPGFKPVQPMVFAGLYPADANEHNSLRSALEKLLLTDSAVTVSNETRYSTFTILTHQSRFSLPINFFHFEQPGVRSWLAFGISRSVAHGSIQSETGSRIRRSIIRNPRNQRDDTNYRNFCIIKSGKRKIRTIESLQNN